MALKVVLGENGATINVGDKEYKLSPLTLGDIADAEEKFGCDLEGFEKCFKKVSNLLFLVWLSLKRRHGDITIQTVKDMFKVSDMGELNTILSSILSLSGMVTEKNEQGTT